MTSQSVRETLHFGQDRRSTGATVKKTKRGREEREELKKSNEKGKERVMKERSRKDAENGLKY
jgi:hypothetical protein